MFQWQPWNFGAPPTVSFLAFPGTEFFWSFPLRQHKILFLEHTGSPLNTKTTFGQHTDLETVMTPKQDSSPVQEILAWSGDVSSYVVLTLWSLNWPCQMHSGQNLEGGQTFYELWVKGFGLIGSAQGRLHWNLNIYKKLLKVEENFQIPKENESIQHLLLKVKAHLSGSAVLILLEFLSSCSLRLSYPYSSE